MFTKAFMFSALENAIQAGAASFTGSLFFSSGDPTLRGLAAGGIGAGMAALYTFCKALGAKQTISALTALESVKSSEK